MGNLDAPSLQVHTQIWLLGSHPQLRNLKNLNDFGQMTDSLRALICPSSEMDINIPILFPGHRYWVVMGVAADWLSNRL